MNIHWNTDELFKGATGDEVKKLQEFLTTNCIGQDYKLTFYLIYSITNKGFIPYGGVCVAIKCSLTKGGRNDA